MPIITKSEISSVEQFQLGGGGGNGFLSTKTGSVILEQLLLTKT